MSIESRSRQYGKVFDHWQIKEFLGSGSGGKTAVFRLVRSDSGWGVSALKVINLIEERGDINALSDYRKREYEYAREECSKNAEQEVRLMDDLRGNTNIVDYLDHTFVDWSDDSGFGRDLLIRMELLEDLRSEIRSGKIFSEREVLKIGRDICIALIRCHRKNILHRDVKPENIFRNKDGDYKLGDFGVSRVLDACPGAVASTGIGTYEYWPAEQMTGRYDKRVDIYSLGLVLYELCNQNRLPFAASTYVTSKEVSMRLTGTPLPAPSGASLDLAEVILKACAFDPDERYQSSEELLRAINHVISGLKDFNKQKTQKPKKPKGSYETLSAEAAEGPVGKYKTMPAMKVARNNRDLNAQEKLESYATEPAGKYFPGKIKKRRAPKYWTYVAILGLCMVAFGIGCIIADAYRERLDGHAKDNPKETIQEGVIETAAAETTIPTESEWTTLPIESIAAAEPVVKVTEPVHMQAIRVKTGANTSYDDGATGDILYEYNSDGYLVQICSHSNEKTSYIHYVYNNVTLMEEVSAISDEGSLLNDSERRVRKKSLYDFLKNKVGYAETDSPSFHLINTDENGYVVRYAVIQYLNWNDADPINITDYYVTFDAAMNEVLRVGYNDGKKTDVKESKYNENNQVICIDNNTDIETSGIPQIRIETNYDNSGRKIKSVVTRPRTGTVEETTLYEYGADGFTCTEESHVRNGVIQIIENRLDNYGNVSDSICRFEGQAKYELHSTVGYKRHDTYETIYVPADQVSTLCNTYDGVGAVTYSAICDEEIKEQEIAEAVSTSYKYTGKIIRSDSVNVRAEATGSSSITTTLKFGDTILVYETAIAENMAWGRCDAGWVYLYYVDLTPVTNGAVDARVVYNDNTIIYTDVDCNGVAGTYSRMSVVDIYEISGKMARTELGWINTDNLL